MNLSLLVHTFNAYHSLWDGLLASYRKHWNQPIDLYFGTNTPHHDRRHFDPFKVIYSGKGEWSNRLIKLLEQIPTDYVLYMQEDHYLKGEPPNLSFMMDLVKKFDYYRLQLSPIIQFYSLYGDRFPLNFWEVPKSKYLVCHQPSIWKKYFLLSCLEKNEDPWTNEYQGTVRLWARTNEIKGKIAIWPHKWYSHEHVSPTRKSEFV